MVKDKIIRKFENRNLKGLANDHIKSVEKICALFKSAGFNVGVTDKCQANYPGHKVHFFIKGDPKNTKGRNINTFYRKINEVFNLDDDNAMVGTLKELNADGIYDGMPTSVHYNQE